jgi:hypothetical protein
MGRPSRLSEGQPATSVVQAGCLEGNLQHESFKQAVWRATCNMGRSSRLSGGQLATRVVQAGCLEGNLHQGSFKQAVWRATCNKGRSSRLSGGFLVSFSLAQQSSRTFLVLLATKEIISLYFLSVDLSQRSRADVSIFGH